MAEKFRKGLVYRWEDTAALDHKCGTCKTVLSSAKAKKTCFGKHEEVCIKYHKTLHFVGQSHNCDSCRKSSELHDKRHREIAKLVWEIQHHDDPDVETAPGDDLGSQSRRPSLVTEDGSLIIGPKAGAAAAKHGVRRPATEPDLHDENTTPEQDDARDNKTSYPADPRSKPENKRAAKAVLKASKSQSRHRNLTTFAREDVDRVRSALHEPIPQDDLHAEILTEPQHVPLSDYAGWRGGKDQLVRNPANRTWVEATAKITPSKGTASVPARILPRLNVNFEAAVANRETKGLLGKLCDAIFKDLTMVENEEKATRMRMDGYWRYVHKKTYDEMVHNNQEWDWESGVKITSDATRTPAPEEAVVDEPLTEGPSNGSVTPGATTDGDDGPLNERKDRRMTPSRAEAGAAVFKFVLPSPHRHAQTDSSRSRSGSERSFHTPGRTYRDALILNATPPRSSSPTDGERGATKHTGAGTGVSAAMCDNGAFVDADMNANENDTPFMHPRSRARTRARSTTHGHRLGDNYRSPSGRAGNGHETRSSVSSASSSPSTFATPGSHRRVCVNDMDSEYTLEDLAKNKLFRK
ncbi:MAG: hypothetical protein M1838_004528 [Thelocarpon superellum]|nr:MAG: hypothetical protein M1838_004528 [Thelocarpon superellum]